MSDGGEFNYPPELPIVEHREHLLALLRDSQVVIVCGDTGSGKTTQIPKMATPDLRAVVETPDLGTGILKVYL